MKNRIISFVISAFVAASFSCKEEGRYVPDSASGAAPGKVSNVTYTPLYGGARFFYSLPSNEDLLQVEAEYTGKSGKNFLFSASYFVDSLDVYGFSDTKPTEVRIYAVSRAGKRSEPVAVSVTPLEPAYTRVASSIIVKPGFSSFFMDWENELEQNVNVYVDFGYEQDGATHSYTSIFASNLRKDRRFVNDLYLSPSEPVSVKVRVEDRFGNITEHIDKGRLHLLEDIKIPKDKWFLPEPNDTVGGIPMCFGNGLEGRNRYVVDDIIDRGDNLNFMHTQSRGRTGRSADGNMPWNFIIDLGDYYELSRIVTVQRHSGGLANVERGQYYKYENVGIFRLYVWDETKNGWSETIAEHKVEEPQGLSEIEFVKKGEAGDMFYFYPDDPKYTKRTRWFRYEAYKGFGGNYTLDDANCLSEITLYGRKAN